MATVIKLPGTTINAPIQLPDPILTPGSLMLFEPAHPANPVIGVPSHDAVMPNIAATQAAALTGSAANTGFVYQTGWTPAEGKVERTARGGLHIIPSTTSSVINNATQVLWQSAIYEYIGSNLGHQWYLSWWGEATREPAAGADNTKLAGASTATADEISLIIQETGTAIATPTGSSGRRTGAAFEDHGNRRRYSVAGTGAAPTGTILNELIKSMADASAKVGKTPAVVHYRVYVEDLTASGRTYAQVDALDAAIHAAAFGAGGRYSGDTWTNPASVA